MPGISCSVFRIDFVTPMFYPEGPHLGGGFKKAINLKVFPQQTQIISAFLESGISGEISQTILWMNEMSSRILSMERELLQLRKP
jgi:hypothetical protein